MLRAPSEDFVRNAKLLRVIDGDTLRVEVDLAFGIAAVHDVRLSEINTPENRGKESPAGHWVTNQVRNWLGEDPKLVIHSQRFTLGKFGRCICRVWSDGRCLNDWLTDQGMGWQTDDNGTLIEERFVDNLPGIPDGIKQQIREAML